MFVKELLQKLQTMDQDAKVLIHCWEDFASANEVITKETNSNPDAMLYCKGYSFEEYHQHKPFTNYIVITDKHP